VQANEFKDRRAGALGTKGRREGAGEPVLDGEAGGRGQRRDGTWGDGADRRGDPRAATSESGLVAGPDLARQRLAPTREGLAGGDDAFADEVLEEIRGVGHRDARARADRLDGRRAIDVLEKLAAQRR